MYSIYLSARHSRRGAKSGRLPGQSIEMSDLVGLASAWSLFLREPATAARGVALSLSLSLSLVALAALIAGTRDGSAFLHQTRMGVDRIYRALNAAIGNRYRGATGSSHSSYTIPLSSSLSCFLPPPLPPSLSLSLSLSSPLYRNPSFTFLSI